MVAATSKLGIVGGILAVGAGSGAGVWGLSAAKRPVLISVSQEENDEQQYKYRRENIGLNYGRYFLSSKHNVWKWKELYTRYEDDFNSLTDRFRDVTQGYSESESTALNQVCKSAYKVTSPSDLTNDKHNASGKYITRNIWRYCALGDIETYKEYDADLPLLPSDRRSIDDHFIGTHHDNSHLLVYDGLGWNTWFWKIRAEEFWSGKGDRSKYQVREASPAVPLEEDLNFFRRLRAKKDKSWHKFRKACFDVGVQPISDTYKNQENALLFCSIKLDLMPQIYSGLGIVVR